MTKVIVLLIILACAIVIQAADFRRAFYFYNINQPTNVTLAVGAINDIANRNCSCENSVPNSFSCNVYPVSLTNPIVSITSLSSSGRGICTLKLTNIGTGNELAIGKLAFFDSFGLSPIARPMVGDVSLFNVTTNPAVSYADFVDLFPGTVKLQGIIIPELLIQSVGTINQFQLSSANKSLIMNYITPQQMRRMVDFEIVQSSGNTELARLQISQPFILYDVPALASVEPKLIRFNDYKPFTVTCQSGHYFTDTGVVMVQFGSNALISSGTLLSTTQFVTSQNISTTATGTTYQVKFSLDRDNYNTSSITVQAFEFPNMASKVTVSGGSFPGSCSIFSVGTTVTLDLDGSGITEIGYTPMLRLEDAYFQRSVNCSWDSKKIVCPCVEIWDLSVNLPQSFKYSLNLNNRDWYNSDSFSSPKITYANPSTFAIDPVGKFGSDDIKSIRIFNITDRFDSNRYNYEFRMQLPSNPSNYRVLSCSIVSSEFNCTLSYDDMSALCCNGNSITSTSCFPSGHCTLNVALVLGRKSDGKMVPSVQFLSAAPFQVYAYFTNNIISVVPQSLAVSTSKTINITAASGTFVNPSLLKYRLRATDNDAIMENALTYHSSSFTSFYADTNVPPLSQPHFDMLVSLNGLTYERFQYHDFRVYNPTQVSFTTFYGSQGLPFSTKPVIANVTLFGKNFFPSTQIKIRYWSPEMTLKIQPCTYGNSTTIYCLTPNVMSLGISLPMNFSIDMTLNSVDYFSSGIYVVFEKSDKPVIVQVIPPRGPFSYNGSDPYLITVKGITGGVVHCLFQQAISDKDTPFDTYMPYAISPVKTAQGEEIQCPVPVGDSNFKRGNSSTGWRLYLYDGATKQYSDPFSFQFYNEPVFTGFSPQDGNAFGREVIYIYGYGFPENLANSISLRLAETVSETRCTQLSNSTIRCITPTHQEGPVQLFISYNDNQFSLVNTTALFQVKPCPPGNTSKLFNIQCQECPSGFYKPVAGFFECMECEFGRYQGLPGQANCMKCPTFSITLQTKSTSLLECDCEAGYFRPNGTTSGIDCKLCPSGGKCPGGGVLPSPQRGYWWDQGRYRSDGSFVFVPCENPTVCTENVTYGVNDGCAIGYRGYICGICDRNYYKSGKECRICDDDVRWRFVIVVLLIVGIVLAAFRFAQLRVSYLSSLSIAVSYFQLIAVFSFYNFKWPDVLKSAFAIFKFFVFDMDIFVPECISEITYGDKYAFTISIPAIFLGIIIILFFVELARSLIARQLRKVIRDRIDHWFILDRKNWYTYQLTGYRRSLAFTLIVPLNIQELKDFLDKLIHTFVVIISFSYVFVVTKAVEVYNCDTISNVRFMRVDPQQRCEGTYYVYFVFSILVLVLFGGGVMIVFSFIVCNRGAIVKNRSFNNRFRFLFIRFRNNRLYWEIIVVIRKLLISLAIIFFAQYPLLVVLFAMLVIFTSFILQVHYVPYRRHFHNVMEYFVLLTCEFLLFCGLLFYVDQFPDLWNRDFLGYLCVVVAVANTVLIVILILFDMTAQLLEGRAEKLSKRKEKQEALRKMELARKDNDSTSGSTARKKPTLLMVPLADAPVIADDGNNNDTQAPPALSPIEPIEPMIMQTPISPTPDQPLAPTPSDQPEAPQMPTLVTLHKAEGELGEFSEEDDSDYDYEEEEAPAPWAMLLEYGDDDVKLREYMQDVVISEDDKDTLLDKLADFINDVILTRWNRFVALFSAAKASPPPNEKEIDTKELKDVQIPDTQTNAALPSIPPPLQPLENEGATIEPQPNMTGFAEPQPPFMNQELNVIPFPPTYQGGDQFSTLPPPQQQDNTAPATQPPHDLF